MNNNNNYMYLISLLFFVVLSVFFVMNDQESNALGKGSGGIGPSLVVLCFLYSLVVFCSIRKKYSSTLVFFSLFYAWINIVNIITIDASYYVVLYRIAFYTIPIITLILCYSYARNEGLDRRLLIPVLVGFVVLTIQYFRIRFLSGENSLLFMGGDRLLCVNYPLFLVPLLLSFSNRKFLIVFVVVILFITFSSGKRSTLIAVVIALLVYLLINSFYKNGMTVKSFLVFSVLLYALYYLISFIDVINEGLLSERLLNITDDGGSGRDYVWEGTIRMIEKQDFTHSILGSGHDGVVRNSVYKLSAHNDFLEIRYDYGLIGVSLFIISLFSLLKKCSVYIYKRNNYASHLLSLIAMFGVLTMISHVVYYYIMVMASISLGLLLGAADNEDFKKRIQLR